MLQRRLLLSAVLIALLAAMVWLDTRVAHPGTCLLAFWMAVCLFGTRELLGLFRADGDGPPHWVVYLGNAFILASNAMALLAPDAHPSSTMEPSGWPLLATALAVFVAFVAEILRFRRPGGVTANLAAAVFAFVYIGLLGSCVAQLRLLGDPLEGLVRVISLVAIVKAGDTGAYLVGTLTGRHKMAPIISPGKTIEGAWGALVGALAAAAIVLQWLSPAWFGSDGGRSSWAATIVYGLVLGAAGMIGDLAESLLKRDSGQKDSGNVLPGLGGVLDVLDSILLAAPVAYLFWVFRWVQA